MEKMLEILDVHGGWVYNKLTFGSGELKNGQLFKNTRKSTTGRVRPPDSMFNLFNLLVYQYIPVMFTVVATGSVTSQTNGTGSQLTTVKKNSYYTSVTTCFEQVAQRATIAYLRTSKYF